MARIDYQKVAFAVGMGGADNWFEKQDADAARTGSFKTWTDLFRLGVAGAGYLMQVMDFQPRIGVYLADSASPLLAKSALKPLMEKAGLASPANPLALPHVTRVVRTQLQAGPMAHPAAAGRMVEQRIPSQRQGI